MEREGRERRVTNGTDSPDELVNQNHSTFRWGGTRWIRLFGSSIGGSGYFGGVDG